MNDVRPVAIGCMRLSTDPDRNDDRSLEVLHAAFDAGVTLLDTADAYCLDERDIGHNERLIARAISTWSGDRSRITIATKGGMTRPEGRWETDGRAKHLRTACERSCRALGVDRLALYQLHVPDPRIPLSTSVRALAALKRDGLVAGIGLSNVTVGQIDEARRITEIDSVQVELSVWNDGSILSGVAAVLHREWSSIAGLPSAGRTAVEGAHAESPGAAGHCRLARRVPVRHCPRLDRRSVRHDRSSSWDHSRRNSSGIGACSAHRADPGPIASCSVTRFLRRAFSVVTAPSRRHLDRTPRSSSSWACLAPARQRSPSSSFRRAISG
jgi:aryl-alcohol dehydrogenase-like predicted oxidoreductase